MNIFIAYIDSKIATLTTDESWHCAKVLRMKSGENVKLIDGKGGFFEGILTLVNEKKCVAEIVSSKISEKRNNYYLHLAIAPTKQIDRIEWMIEKAVEIGIDEISFIKCKNSERINIKPERIVKIVESAVKQSLQSFIPKVNELILFRDILLKKSDNNLIAHCSEGIKNQIKSFDFVNKSTLILIGPEGDFTDEEIELATKNNFNSVSLGQNRLRTETAGLYVCQAISILSSI